MGFSIGNLVSKILPKVIPAVGNILAGPVGQLGLDILKQLASSVFSKDGKGGLFSENVQLTLPNPLSRLNGLLGNIGTKIGGIGDFLRNIGNFLQGNRQLENGTNVNVPRLGDRAATTATSAASTSADIASGRYDAALSTSRSASTTTGTATGGAVSRIGDSAFSTGLSPQQNSILAKAKAGGADETQLAQMKAQMEMTNLQNLMQFMSNIMRIMGDISKGVIQNIR